MGPLARLFRNSVPQNQEWAKSSSIYSFMLPGLSYHISRDVNVLKLGSRQAKKSIGAVCQPKNFLRTPLYGYRPQLASRSKSLAFLRRKKEREISRKKKSKFSPSGNFLRHFSKESLPFSVNDLSIRNVVHVDAVSSLHFF